MPYWKHCIQRYKAVKSHTSIPTYEFGLFLLAQNGRRQPSLYIYTFKIQKYYANKK